MEIILDYRLVDSYNNGSVETNFSSFFFYFYIYYIRFTFADLYIPSFYYFFLLFYRCHRPRDSLFSWSSGFDNFTGFVNWGFLLLGIGGIRLLLENFIK